MEEVNIHFGYVGKALPDWRDRIVPGEDDDNDEDEDVMPDVKAILGVDPDKI